MSLDNISDAETRQKVLVTWEGFECAGKGGGLFDHFILL